MLKFIIVQNCKNILGETASSREGLIPRGFMLKKKEKEKKDGEVSLIGLLICLQLSLGKFDAYLFFYIFNYC